ncbi:MAG: hypothetical protein RJB13_2485 [Pseudomonadota bacterium]|jgi:flagellar FliL protein
MSKEENKNEDGKKEKAKEPKGPPDEIAETRKKRKLVLFAGLTGVIATAAAAGGFFVYKTFVQKPPALAAKADPNDQHASAPTGEHAEGSKDGGGAEAHGEDKSADTAKDAHADKSKDEQKDEKDNVESKKSDDKAKADEKATADGDAKTEEKSDVKMFQSDETFGETFALKKMELNLGNPLENRYLRIAVSLEYTGGKDQLDELQKREPQLRDLIISSVSSRTRLDLLTEKGKEKLRRELINKINESFEKPVKTLYFTDFLVE